MNINLYTWYSKRELDYCPKHFISANTPITEESKSWILERLQGRFYIQSIVGNYENKFTNAMYGSHVIEVPVFEDPEEATLYELTWS